MITDEVQDEVAGLVVDRVKRIHGFCCYEFQFRTVILYWHNFSYCGILFIPYCWCASRVLEICTTMRMQILVVLECNLNGKLRMCTGGLPIHDMIRSCKWFK
ncbi:hypothetical protein NPIL_166921 [Nephila pilipes]|uniref:Uncharacterized protein n=1 Tax=Nephila pilipes TaxID=299642 RepID=A0A8X6IGM5_NEPPI|nr:hypothetical protein NPIL_166921 [Nephila pilipes]